MKTKSFLLIASLTLILMLFSVSNVQAYSDNLNRFSITPPTGWTTQEGVEGTVVVFLGPQDPDVGSININIDIQQTIQTLNTIIGNTKQSWSATYSNYTLMTDKNIVINGFNGHELKISYDQDGASVIQDSLLFLDNDALYQVTYLAGPTTYETYSANWIESLNTFHIVNAPSSTDSSSGFSFNFELTGLPLLLLLAAVAIIFIVLVVVLVKRSKAKSSRINLPPPPPSYK
jgi:hypothetical protein